nr:hypothetical protein BgiMline_020225 [Biomphalaria glabrata]
MMSFDQVIDQLELMRHPIEIDIYEDDLYNDLNSKLRSIDRQNIDDMLQTRDQKTSPLSLDGESSDLLIFAYFHFVFTSGAHMDVPSSSSAHRTIAAAAMLVVLPVHLVVTVVHVVSVPMAGAVVVLMGAGVVRLAGVMGVPGVLHLLPGELLLLAGARRSPREREVIKDGPNSAKAGEAESRPAPSWRWGWRCCVFTFLSCHNLMCHTGTFLHRKFPTPEVW